MPSRKPATADPISKVIQHICRRQDGLTRPVLRIEMRRDLLLIRRNPSSVACEPEAHVCN